MGKRLEKIKENIVEDMPKVQRGAIVRFNIKPECSYCKDRGQRFKRPGIQIQDDCPSKRHHINSPFEEYYNKRGKVVKVKGGRLREKELVVELEETGEEVRGVKLEHIQVIRT